MYMLSIVVILSFYVPYCIANEIISDTPSISESVNPEHIFQIKVPTYYLNNNYYLSIRKKQIALTDLEDLTQFASDKRHLVTLHDKYGRILSRNRVYLNDQLFRYVRNRGFRVGIFVGEAYNFGNAFKRIFQDGKFIEHNLDLSYHPDRLGINISLATLNNYQNNSGEFTAEFSAVQIRAAMQLETVPLIHSRKSFQTIHISYHLGILLSHNKLKVYDNMVSLKDSNQHIGIFSGLQARLPIVYNLWASSQLDIIHQRYKFATFGFNTSVTQYVWKLGVTYAF